jgi:hypothetical protein
MTLGAAGCSFAAVYGPAPATKPRIDVTCTDERYAPALDLAAAGVNLGELASGNLSDTKGARAAALLGALAFGASSIYGFVVTSECRDAKDAAYRYHTRILQRQYDVLDEFTSSSTPSDPVPGPAPGTVTSPNPSPRPRPAPPPSPPPDAPPPDAPVTPAPPAPPPQ